MLHLETSTRFFAGANSFFVREGGVGASICPVTCPGFQTRMHRLILQGLVGQSIRDTLVAFRLSSFPSRKKIGAGVHRKKTLNRRWEDRMFF